MRTLARRALAHSLVWRALGPARRAGVVVLAYHRIGAAGSFTAIDADVFRAQMRWVRDNCEVIDAAALESRLAGRGRRTRPSVLVTFDDGYRDYHDVAYPILREYGIPAVNFLPTRFIDEGALFWWDLLDLAVAISRRLKAPDDSGRVQSLRDAQSRRAYAQSWKGVLKGTPAPERTPALARALQALDVHPEAVRVPRQVMTWDEVRATRELTTFGGHTHTHPIMPLLAEAELEREAALCRDRIAAETGAVPRTFAYPSGMYNDRAKAAVARAGFDFAFGTDPGFNVGTADRMALLRIDAPRSADRLPPLLAGWR